MIALGLDKTVVRKPVESRASYRDLVVDAILSAASGNGDSTGGAASGLEMAASRWSRALASARASHPSVTPQFLSDIGRRLCRSGECVFDLRVDPSRGVLFFPACDWQISGGADPDGWSYRLTLPGPTSTITVTRPAAGVAHFRYSSSERQPWIGLSPLAMGERVTGALLPVNVESALSRRGWPGRGDRIVRDCPKA